MVGSLIKLVWNIVTLPLRLILLPFKIASFVISAVIYGFLALILLGLLFVFVL